MVAASLCIPVSQRVQIPLRVRVVGEHRFPTFFGHLLINIRAFGCPARYRVQALVNENAKFGIMKLFWYRMLSNRVESRLVVHG